MRTLIYLFLFSTSLYAKEITVEDGRLKYKLTYDAKEMRYQDEASELSLVKKDCNSHIVDRFEKKLDRFLEKPFLNDTRPGFLKIKIDGKEMYEPRFGDRAVFLVGITKEFKTLKIEESLNCVKNRKGP